MQSNPNITIAQIALYLDIPKRTIENNVKKLKDKHIIERLGADKNGIWRGVE
jgi:predicted HTH transcriptional regulator